MRTIALMAGLALSVAATPAAEAACKKRTTGTVVGAVTGGLLGNVVAGRGDRTEGTLLGAAAGGLVGNQVSKCDPKPRRTTRARTTQRVAQAPACRWETRTFYDAYGEPVRQQVRVCGR